MTPLLEIKTLRVRFSGVPVLDVEELTVPVVPGVAALFMGPNGAGKTTLLNAITGYAAVDPGGRIILRARAECQLQGRSRSEVIRRGVARTFQAPSVFGSLTVGESVRLAARLNDARSWAGRLAGLLCPLDGAPCGLGDALLDGLSLAEVADRPLGDLTLELLRRAELARCLATQPRLLLIDEPSAGADPTERDRLTALLRNELTRLIDRLYAAGLYRWAQTTTCVVTHDMDFAAALSTGPTSPTVHLLNAGRVLTSGPLSVVAADRRVQEAYLGQGQAL